MQLSLSRNFLSNFFLVMLMGSAAIDFLLIKLGPAHLFGLQTFIPKRLGDALSWTLGTRVDAYSLQLMLWSLVCFILSLAFGLACQPRAGTDLIESINDPIWKYLTLAFTSAIALFCWYLGCEAISAPFEGNGREPFELQLLAAPSAVLAGMFIAMIYTTSREHRLATAIFPQACSKDDTWSRKH